MGEFFFYSLLPPFLSLFAYLACESVVSLILLSEYWNLVFIFFLAFRSVVSSFSLPFQVSHALPCFAPIVAIVMTLSTWFIILLFDWSLHLFYLYASYLNHICTQHHTILQIYLISHSPWVDLGPLARISHSLTCTTQYGSSRPLPWLMELCRGCTGLDPTTHFIVPRASLPNWSLRLRNEQYILGSAPDWTANCVVPVIKL